MLTPYQKTRLRKLKIYWKKQYTSMFSACKTVGFFGSDIPDVEQLADKEAKKIVRQIRRHMEKRNK